MGSGIIKLDASVISTGNAVGKKEYEGPLGKLFDICGDDDRFGQKTWEKAESEMQRLALNMALKKAEMGFDDIDAMFSGDLLNQCVGSSYAHRGNMIPYLGLYGACSTSAEGMILASAMTSCGLLKRCAVVTGSHNCSAERQYRMPIEYGGQRPQSSQWTVTGSGAFIIGGGECGKVKIKAGMPGRIVDKGITDAANMGAAMAPAVCDTICRFFSESGLKVDDLDLIITGDLGYEGLEILRDLLHIEGYDPGDRLNDCGVLMYDREKQDTHSGGSGCGCSASVMSAHIIPQLEKGRLKRILFIASGALMNPDMLKQGESIPGIGHLLQLESSVD